MDKREAVRIPVRVRAQCRSSGLVIDGLVEDVSRSGLFFTTLNGFRPGTAAELDLDIPGEDPLHLAVEVVRVEKREDRVGMGLRLLDRPEPSRTLANFIMRQHQTFR